MNDFDETLEIKIGEIIEVRGSSLIAKLDGGIDELTRIYEGRSYHVGQIGSIVKIHFGQKILFGFVTLLRMNLENINSDSSISVLQAPIDQRILQIELFSEGFNKPSGLDFNRGIKSYPLPGQNVYLMTHSELRALFAAAEKQATKNSTKSMITIGNFANLSNISAKADIDKMFALHCAVLGSTGSGKSSAVSALIHSVLENENPKFKPRIIIIDPHGEYKKSFGDKAKVYRSYNSMAADENIAEIIKLPCWLMSFSELRNLIIGKTEFEATSQNNMIMRGLGFARKRYLNLVDDFENPESCEKEDDPQPSSGNDRRSARFDIDRPIPFSRDDFINHIIKVQAHRNQSNNLSAEGKKESDHIKNKIDVLINDQRLDFLMSEIKKDSCYTDINEILLQFIGGDKEIKIIDLSETPNEITGILIALISRILFQYKIHQSMSQRKNDPILIVCEEAHRYVPDRGDARYAYAQESIRRIAREGRKYGLGLMLVSQRPADIESTVIAQCSTWLVLRLSNGADQNKVVQFLPDGLKGMTEVLSSLGRQEALFIGEGAILPARIKIRDLKEFQLPKSDDIIFSKGWENDYLSQEDIDSITKRMKGYPPTDHEDD